MSLYPHLTDDENYALNHHMMWGSDSYPIAKRGNKWWVDGMFGGTLGGFPMPFKTKREAAERWKMFMAMLGDRAAKREPGSCFWLRESC